MKRSPGLITAVQSITVAQEANTLVFGDPASGKTAAFAMPLIRDWYGPVVYLTIGGLYPEMAAGREPYGRIITEHIEDTFDRRPFHGLPADAFGTLLITASIKSAESLVSQTGLAHSAAEDLVDVIVRSFRKWIHPLLASVISAGGRHKAPQLLLILDDYWAQTAFGAAIVDAVQNHDANSVRLVFITQMAYAMRKRIGDAEYTYVREHFPTIVQFRSTLEQPHPSETHTDTARAYFEQEAILHNCRYDPKVLQNNEAIIVTQEAPRKVVFQPYYDRPADLSQ